MTGPPDTQISDKASIAQISDSWCVCEVFSVREQDRIGDLFRWMAPPQRGGGHHPACWQPSAGFMILLLGWETGPRSSPALSQSSQSFRLWLKSVPSALTAFSSRPTPRASWISSLSIRRLGDSQPPPSHAPIPYNKCLMCLYNWFPFSVCVH